MKRLMWLALILPVPVVAYAENFACDRTAIGSPNTPDALSARDASMVCYDAELIALRKEIEAAYKAALADKKHTAQVRQQQAMWLALRDYAPLDVRYLRAMYKARLQVLKIRIATTPDGKTKVGFPDRWHYATLLANGKVLVFGADVQGHLSALHYDPKSMRFQPGRSLARELSTVQMPDGRMLAADGSFYDPVSGTFGPGNMPLKAGERSASLGKNKLFVVGGGRDRVLPYAYVYDLATGRSSKPGVFVVPRDNFTATLLRDGRVLVVGGLGMRFRGDREGVDYRIEAAPLLASAEIYDPASGKFTSAGSLPDDGGSISHSATLLPGGKVLIVGGGGNDNTIPRPAHPQAQAGRVLLFDPASNQFKPAGNTVFPRQYHSSTLLKNGQVLIAGGADDIAAATMELYDPAAGKSSLVGGLGFYFFGFAGAGSATLLKNGKVLFISKGGAELYEPKIGRRN